MLRLIAFLIGLAVVIAAAVWLADHPGAATIEWLGWRVSTPVPVLLAVLALLVGGLWTGLRLFAAVIAWPTRWRQNRAARRQRKGYRALSDGLDAAAAGHGAAASRLARQAERLLADPAVTGVLSAQSARLSGDAAAAQSHFQGLLERPETRAMGLRGLLEQAVARGDSPAALTLARQAQAFSPHDGHVAEMLFPLLLNEQRWDEALRLIDTARRRRLLDRATLARRRALVLGARAMAADASQRSAAIADAGRSLAADPGLTAVAVALAGWLQETGDRRRAQRVLQRAWSTLPVPALAAASRAIEPDLAPLPRLRQLEQLVAGQPDHVESLLVLGEAALDARLWGQARKWLSAAATARPTGHPFHLLARLEIEGYDDRAAARRWLDQAANAAPDPLWLCRACGEGTATWTLRCANCGAIDSGDWRSPVPRIGMAAPALALPGNVTSGFIAPPPDAPPA